MKIENTLVIFASALIAVFVVMFFVTAAHQVETPKMACDILVETFCEKEMECGLDKKDLCVASAKQFNLCSQVQTFDKQKIEDCTIALENMSCVQAPPEECWDQFIPDAGITKIEQQLDQIDAE